MPLFVSHRRLAGRRTLPRAIAPWALDSGAFSELSLYGEWRTTAGQYHVYVFAEDGAAELRARFFFEGVVLSEDPATGSGCANLGGWLVASKRPLPLARTVRQGDEVGRPSRLGLRVDAEGRIFVSGRVVELGRGVVSL